MKGVLCRTREKLTLTRTEHTSTMSPINETQDDYYTTKLPMYVMRMYRVHGCVNIVVIYVSDLYGCNAITITYQLNCYKCAQFILVTM